VALDKVTKINPVRGPRGDSGPAPSEGPVGVCGSLSDGRHEVSGPPLTLAAVRSPQTMNLKRFHVVLEVCFCLQRLLLIPPPYPLSRDSF